MSEKKRVVILHEPVPGLDLMLAGIDSFRRSYPGWVIRQQYRHPRTTAELRELLGWRADGWISIGGNDLAVPKGVPWVSLRGGKSPCDVNIDDVAVGACAASQLILMHPATIFLPEAPSGEQAPEGWWVDRRDSCRSTLASLGLKATPFMWHPGIPQADDAHHLVRAILATKPPRVFFAITDDFALELIERLIAVGVSVPSVVAVLGADNLSRSANSRLSLSSICIPYELAGRRAAELLHAMFEGGLPCAVNERLQPTGISHRESTDALAISDPQVARVVSAIASNVTGSFSVKDAVSASTLSRRSIEMRFRSQLGRSVLEEIRRVRIAHACSLLSNPREHVSSVALMCGFRDAAHFAQVFRKVTQMTPSQWKKKRG